jgi:hypothetical protein
MGEGDLVLRRDNRRRLIVYSKNVKRRTFD